MPPLVFSPFLRPMPWGGRRLGDTLGKPLPPDGTWGESWEVSAHPTHVSRVADGPLAGRALTDLLPGFPLLVKYLDANDWLSVQVHPGDDKAMSLSGEPLGKTEAWVVLGAEPGGRIFAGMKDGIDRRAFERALAEKRVAECLHAFQPRVGDCLFYPAGTVHAVGGGVLLAEVQQSSDATLRLYDWDRVGPDGKPRPLHVAQALEAIDWGRGPVAPAVGQALPGLPGERLVVCRYFTLDRFRVAEPVPSPYGGRLSLWMVLDGAAELRARDYRRVLPRGGTVVVPAGVEGVSWHPSPAATLLGVTLPEGLSGPP
ncbi:MAG: type I phosphomannose isomerase catalytic subunit [Gemmataceae bacterium]